MSVLLVLLSIGQLPSDADDIGKLSPSQLRSSADTMVTGRVVSSTVCIERSDHGPGNYDHVVYTEVEVAEVMFSIVGVQVGETIKLRSQLARSRRGLLQMDRIDSHYPIPDKGQLVTCHSYSNGVDNIVVYPNGFLSADGTPINEPGDIVDLRDRGVSYTYFLPVEIWIVLILLSGIMVILFVLTYGMRRPKKKVLSDSVS